MKEQVIKTLLSWLTPPVFEEPEKTRIAGILHVILSGSVALITPICIYELLYPYKMDETVWLDFVIFSLSLGMLRLMRLGYVRLASILFTVMAWLLMAYLALVTGGLPLTFYFAIMILISGTLINMRAGIFTAGLSFAYIFFLAWLEDNQLLPASLVTMTTQDQLVSLTFLFLDSLMFIYLLQNSFRRQIDSMQKVEEMRKASESHLMEKQKAEIASQAKSEFLSSMSHELRTPLNGILGYTQILKRSPKLSDAEKKGIEIIHQSGSHLLTLINDILDLSKIEARKMELHPQDIHLSSFLASVVAMIEMRAQEKELLFVLDADETLPKGIHADEIRLRQVLLNLLGNAVKFTHHGQITFKISSRDDYQGRGDAFKISSRDDYQGDCRGDALRSPPPQGKREALPQQVLRFEIIDTGVGMTSEQLAKIFLPFEQVGETKQRAQGTGLGLAITQQLVKLMGGDIYVESQARKGSRFWFELTLPVVEVARTKEQVSDFRVITGYQGKRLKVLVVDDQTANRAVLRDLLTPLGFEIIEAADGQEAVELTRTIKPDLILTDLVMPVMDGFKAVKAIRLFDAKVPIIAISASVFEAEQLVSLKIGCNAFLSKPLDVQKLLTLMEKHLSVEWLYQESLTDSSQKEEQALIPPPREVLEALYEAAMMGMMSDIRKTWHEIEQMDAKYAPFANKVRELAQNFEDEKIVALVEQYSWTEIKKDE